MKSFRIVVALLFVGLLVFYSFHPWPDFVQKIGAMLLPPSKQEEEVRGVFARYADLLTRGDPRSEAIYTPDARFVFVAIDASGHLRTKTMTAGQHHAASQQVLWQIRAGQIRVRFEDAVCRELTAGKVRLNCTAYLNGDRPQQISMIFVSTGPQHWAVSEEMQRSQEQR